MLYLVLCAIRQFASCANKDSFALFDLIWYAVNTNEKKRNGGPNERELSTCCEHCREQHDFGKQFLLSCHVANG